MHSQISVKQADYSAQVEDWLTSECASTWLESFQSLGIEIAGRTVVDCGCGPGKYLKYFAGSPALLVGVDREILCLREAQKFNSARASFVCGSINQLPIRRQSVDVVLLRYVIHHLSKDARLGLFENIFAALKRCGRLIIETSYHAQFAAHYDHQLFPELSRVAEEIYPDRSDLEKVLTVAGFKIEREVETVQYREPYPSVDAALERSRLLVDHAKGPTCWLRLDAANRRRFHEVRETELPRRFGHGKVPRYWHGTFVVATADSV